MLFTMTASKTINIGITTECSKYGKPCQTYPQKTLAGLECWWKNF